jgi:hypothetical protein
MNAMRQPKRREPLQVEEVRTAIRGFHLIPSESGSWVVRTLGPRGKSRAFPDQSAAVTYANSMKKRTGREIFTHQTDPSK